jgi:hypothetical protein
MHDYHYLPTLPGGTPMFEEELKLEEKESGWVPLLMILALAAAIIAGVLYWIGPTHKPLTAEQAAPLVSDFLKAQGPATVHFHAGIVQASVDEKIRDPHYRLLEKVGVIKVGKAKGDAINVSVTPSGERQFAAIPGVIKSKNPDATDAYTIPLAEHQLVAIQRVTMTGRDVANVQFTWKWAPNQLGDAFDASGPLVKSFNTWDRSTLIQKYGVAFYHVPPAEGSLTFVRGEKGWRLAAE